MGVLENKVAVITGASRGLGEAIGRAFVREGAAVVLAGRSIEAIQALAHELDEQGGRATAYQMDVSDLAQVQALAAHAVETFGTIDIWVNNAGYAGVFGPTTDIEPGDYERVLRTNIFGTYHGSLVALRYFLSHGKKGKLINLLGRGDRNSAPYQSAYGSSKAWVRAFTRTLVKEYGKTDIDILAINPGLMETDLLQKVEVVHGYERKLKGFGTIIRMWANPPTVPAEKIVWLASSATNGKSGMEVNLLGLQQIITGAFNELRGRLTRRPMVDKSPNVRIVEAWEEGKEGKEGVARASNTSHS